MIEHAHHIKALPPALAAMAEAGFTAEQCLEGTGLTEAELLAPASVQGFSLDQQFRFHRNLLTLTGNPLLGLQLGKRYTIENYGLLGYAFMSAPTLRRRLKAENVTFQELKDQCRCEAAIAYLSRPDLSINAVATLMGFTDPSAFHRSFKKWTGMPPGEYRQRHLSGESSLAGSR